MAEGAPNPLLQPAATHTLDGIIIMRSGGRCWSVSRAAVARHSPARWDPSTGGPPGAAAAHSLVGAQTEAGPLISYGVQDHEVSARGG